MKTKEELNALKNEVEALNKKLAELTEEELEKVAGGTGNEDDVKKAFKDALDVFRAAKFKSEFVRRIIVTETPDFSPTEHDKGFLINMIIYCERFLSGERDAKTALYYIQRLYDSLTEKDVKVQSAMENLKTAVGG